MFNGYNDTPLISYELSQERVEKKHENLAKWSSYGGHDGHTGGIQPVQAQPNNRHPEFWTGKSNFLGIPNVVKCNCTGCYLSSEKQSYQGDTTRHRPWLPRTYPVPVNGSNEPCKLPACQWDGVLSNQGSCYPESGLPYVQENGGKYPYYKNHQNSRLAESNQPGVITSVKNVDFGKKSKGEMPLRGQESPVQNGTRQPVFCNPACGLTKRVDGRNYCDSIEKYSNVASYSVDQHIPRLPAVEPFTKTVPSNLSQSRVPSTGYRSVKENMPQAYVDLGYGDTRKICTEETNCEQRNEAFIVGQLQTGVHADYSHFNPEAEAQKLFFDNTRHSEYYSRNNFEDFIKRNSQALENRKDCAMHQINEMIMSEQHYTIPRVKPQEGSNAKSSCDVFYPKELDKPRPDNHLPANSACFQRSDDTKNENAHAQTRLPPSALLFNDPRFADRTQNSFTCQSNPVAYRNYIRPEYPYQGYNTAQARYECPSGLQRNDLNQFRGEPQQVQNCEQLPMQQGTGFAYDPHFQPNSDKTQQLFRGKHPSPVQPESQPSENKKPTHLEAIRSEELNKNGTSKISPLRLLRRKKFINVPQEPAPASTLDAIPGLDVRKFWSTWAEEEEENAAPTQMVVLDCQNIDPEQAKLLHLYETDPVRPIHLDANTVIKNADVVKDPGNETIEVKTCEQLMPEPKMDEPATPKHETEVPQQDKTEKTEEKTISETENRTDIVESVCPKKPFKKGKSGKKKAEIMDKWTEKKFDFLKRAEESKAAEILRHEEEKKKIFETRLSLQQNVKKIEKLQEKTIKKGEECVPERSQFDENSRSDSPENDNAADLPTSEYRRNKFLDYSDRKEVLNGEDELKLEDGRAILEEPAEVKKENESSEKWPLFPKLKEAVGFEMEDILKKMSEINFQNAEVKLENGLENVKKLKSGKKLKKRKQDHQPENEELTVETVTKPTIKFSIQKSHDLKISFKVLNSKEYSDEDIGGEGAEDEGKADEDSKNSTELITLKYKSIKRDGDRRQLDLKKKRRRFRQKKHTPKTPVLKIKKSRYMPQEERDPLADDDDTSDKCSASEGFQVEETMDSAKIKLTFKRHKGNFETEYKINSSNLGKDAEGDSMLEENDEQDETDKDECRKPGIFAEAGVENFQDHPEPTSDPEDNSYELEPVLEEDSRNSSTSPDPYVREDPHFRLEPFSQLPSGPELTETPDRGACEEETIKLGDSDSEERSNRGPDHLADLALNHVEDECKRDEFPRLAKSPSPGVNLKQLTPDEVVSVGDGKAANFQQEEEIQEISLDFITSTKSQEIKSNCDSGKTVESETSTRERNDAEALEEKQSPDGIGISETGEDSSCGVKPLEEMTLANSKIHEGNVDEVKSSAEKDCVEESGEPETKIDENGNPPIKETTEEENQQQISFENFETTTTTPETSPERIHCPPEELETEKPDDNTNNHHSSSGSEDGRTSFDLFPTEQPEKNAFETYLDPETVEENQIKACVFENSGFSRKNSRNEIDTNTDCEIADMYIDEVQLPDSKPSEIPLDDEQTVRKAVALTKEGTDEVEEKENLSESKGTMEAIENMLTSPIPSSSPINDRALRDSGCPESGFTQESTEDYKIENVPFELEDGEILDGCDELEADSSVNEKNENQSLDVLSNSRKKYDFILRKIERRNSTSEATLSWSRKRFSKAKSCPPKLTFPLPLRAETPSYIPIENIPLPLGPPPWECCFDFGKYRNCCKTLAEQTQPEAKEKPKESTPTQKEVPPNTSTPEMSEPPPPGILQRSGKIKFSFIKRSKFSKIGLKTCQNSKPEASTQAEMKLKGQAERKDELPDVESKPIERDLVPTECQMEVPKPEVPDTKEANNPEDAKSSGNDPDPVGLSCEDLGETVGVIDTMNDFIRNQFYECEDIPTSEDLTNGEDPEIEKVNDDKFRNIMQNCLDNAKKFLNVGNLKLFSCSVDDLFELECQDGSASSLGENETEKPVNHISRDVLLTSCEDTNDDLGLSENIQPAEISMDFVPSFCSDVCPEILPVDNWPYLEEEVPSSPVKTKPDDADLIPTLENMLSGCDTSFPHKNGIERRRKRVVSETTFKRFRRKSLLSDGETLKIGVQRRKTIDSVTGVNLRDIKSDIILLKSEAESRSLKCRLSLDQITSKQKNERMPPDAENMGRRKSLDYRSPSWQPKVMLFRISKTELRKVLKSSKSSHRRFVTDDSTKRKVSCELEKNVAYAIKKRKLDPEFDKLYIKPVQEFREAIEDRESPNEERWIDLSRLDSIKGSLMSADPEARKRKKSRFRNLHTKRKSESVGTKDISSSAESVLHSETMLVDAEAAIAEIFRDCDRVSVKNPKLFSIKDSDQRPEKKPTCESESSSKSERRSQNETETTHRSKEEWKRDRHRERKHDHRDRRREKSEGREQSKRENKHKENESKKHRSSHDSSRHHSKRSPSRHSKAESELRGLEKRSSGEGGNKWRPQREASPEACWVCEVCGFSDASERVVHIKNHPFHCQSCHLAFKTEAHFTRHLTKKHKDIRNQHHCLLCELSFDTEYEYQGHLETREHRHLESVEKNTINTLFTLLTGAPCPVFGLVEMRPEWLPNQAGTVHFYHQATPLSLALQYLKMHHELSLFSTQSSAHPN